MHEQEAYDKMMHSKKFLTTRASNLRYYNKKNEKFTESIDVNYIEKLK